MSQPHPSLPPLRSSILRTILRLVLVLAFAYVIHLSLDWLMHLTDDLPQSTGAALRALILAIALIAYALMIAIPFVPGIEIGISLVLMRGAEIAPLVYLATAGGLLISYYAGRLMPYRWLMRLFEDLRLKRAAALLQRIEPLGPERRLALMRRQLPGRLGQWAVNYRYLALALLINMPGSFLIGGGGGICLMAGLTRLFRPRATTITIALAVLPFPLTVWFFGPGILS